MGNIIVGQSGGPTAVINASLAGVFKAGTDIKDAIVYGMINGVQGLLERRYINLSKEIKSELDIELLKKTPSSYLGSCRFKLPNLENNMKIYEQIFQILDELSVDKFFYIGGNDSMDTIKKLHRYAVFKNRDDIKFIGVPKTIDNDLCLTDHTPGYGSACKYIATTIKEIIKDATVYDLKNITIIEIMGRSAGWLTASAILAKGEDCEGVDLIYLPETIFDVDDFVKRVEALQKTKKSIVIAVSEGIKNKDGIYVCELEHKNTLLDSFGHKSLSGTANILAIILARKLNCKTRAIELNTTQRCAGHIVSLVDVQESFFAGAKAVRIASKGRSGKVITFKRISNHPYKIEIGYNDVSEIANEEQIVPLKYIDTKHKTIKKEFLEYVLPLIQGESYPIMVNGLPRHLKLDKK